jgi:hypothetical protein
VYSLSCQAVAGDSRFALQRIHVDKSAWIGDCYIDKKIEQRVKDDIDAADPINDSYELGLNGFHIGLVHKRYKAMNTCALKECCRIE